MCLRTDGQIRGRSGAPQSQALTYLPGFAQRQNVSRHRGARRPQTQWHAYVWGGSCSVSFRTPKPATCVAAARGDDFALQPLAKAGRVRQSVDHGPMRRKLCTWMVNDLCGVGGRFRAAAPLAAPPSGRAHASHRASSCTLTNTSHEDMSSVSVRSTLRPHPEKRRRSAAAKAGVGRRHRGQGAGCGAKAQGAKEADRPGRWAAGVAKMLKVQLNESGRTRAPRVPKVQCAGCVGLLAGHSRLSQRGRGEYMAGAP